MTGNSLSGTPLVGAPVSLRHIFNDQCVVLVIGVHVQTWRLPMPRVGKMILGTFKSALHSMVQTHRQWHDMWRRDTVQSSCTGAGCIGRKNPVQKLCDFSKGVHGLLVVLVVNILVCFRCNKPMAHAWVHGDVVGHSFFLHGRPKSLRFFGRRTCVCFPIDAQDMASLLHLAPRFRVGVTEFFNVGTVARHGRGGRVARGKNQGLSATKTKTRPA